MAEKKKMPRLLESILNQGEIDMGAIIGLLILAADIWATLNIAQSRAKDGAKVLWILLVLVLPLAGLIVWYFAGPKKK
jgi:uncharacterized membrane protein YhaH (DUF805 family)